MGCNSETAFLWGPGGPAASRFRVLIAALGAVFLLGLGIYVYSPLHRDEPGVGNLCPFCAFQHLSAEPAAAWQAIGEPSPPPSWLAAGHLPLTPSFAIARVRRDRAPPVSFFAI